MSNGVRIGDLFGKDILKNIQNQEYYGPNAKRIANQSKTSENTKQVALELLEQYPIKAIYPSISPECLRLTMENYRKHIHKYNLSIIEQNKEIRKFNSNVELFLSKNNLDLVQSEYSRLFMKRYGKMKKYVYFNPKTNQDEIKEKYTFNFFNEQDIRDYNEAVDGFCEDYGLIVKKRELQTIKPISEKIFMQVLFCYNTQMYSLNKHYIKIGFAKPTTLPKVNIHTSHIIHFRKDEEIKILDLSPRTIKRHIERLTEAGVFQYYQFLGTNRPPRTFINPEILVVFDEKTAKIASPENQRFNSENVTVCLDNKKITRTDKDKFNISESGKADIQEKGVSASLQRPFIFFYKTTTEQGSDLANSGGGENVKVEETLSEKLRKLILHPSDLAEKLASGDYNNYTPIDIRALTHEAYHGTLTNEEFRELFVCEFFKISAKLYKGKNVYPGSWSNAIHDFLNSSRLKAFTGKAFNKYVMIDNMIEWRWRLEFARKWFVKHNEVRILFPSDYFDIKRVTNKEIGFEYTKKAYQNHLKSIEKTEARLKNQELKAKQRQYSNTRLKMVQNKVNQFFKNKINFQELVDYVSNNYPEYTDRIAHYINKKSIQC